MGRDIVFGVVRKFGAMKCHGFLAVLVLTSVECAMILMSPAFKKFQAIPAKYGCDATEGRNHLVPSPPLNWTRVPAKTRSFILMVDDLDDPGFIHWLVKDIPADVTMI